MYSEKLEQLIKSVIADGVITEKERAVLHKRAAAEGIDADEIDVYVEGLLPEAGSNTTSNAQQQPAKRDLTGLEKYRGKDFAIYELKEKLRLPAPNVRNSVIYMTFAEVTESYQNKWNGLYIALLAITGDQKGFYASNSRSSLHITADDSSMELKGCFTYDRNTTVSGKKVGEVLYFRIDDELLKMMCDARALRFSAEELRYDFGYASFAIPDCSPENFIQYARLAYRKFVDPTAYTDAVYLDTPAREETKQDSTVPRVEAKQESGNQESARNNDDDTARLLGAKPKSLQRIPVESKFFNQYRDFASGLEVIHFKERRMLMAEEGDLIYRMSLKLFAVKDKDSKLKYYFELINELPKDNEKVSRNLLGLEGGYIALTIGAKEMVLKPVTNSVKLLAELMNDEYYEHNYYPIDDNSLSSLVMAGQLNLKVSGSQGISVMAKNPWRKPANVPKEWASGYNQLTNPDAPTEISPVYDSKNPLTMLFNGIEKLMSRIQALAGR